MPSLGYFLTPPQAVWISTNIFIGFRKGGLQLFKELTEVCLRGQQFLQEVGPESTVSPEGEGSQGDTWRQGAAVQSLPKHFRACPV